VSIAFIINATATTAPYPLSLHDALPIYAARGRASVRPLGDNRPRFHVDGERRGVPSVRVDAAARRIDDERFGAVRDRDRGGVRRSEEHTSELQSLAYLVCRLLLEKKNEQ